MGPAASTNYFEKTRAMYGPESEYQTAADQACGGDCSEGGVTGWQYAAKVAFSNIRFGTTLGSTYDQSTDQPQPSTTAPPQSTQPQPSGIQQLNQRCGGSFGNCQPELVCLGNELQLCVKPQKEMAHKQLNESCDDANTCSPNGLLCHDIEGDYKKCIIDPSWVPVSTQQPSTGTTPEPSTTTSQPTTTQATTQSSDPGASSCHVCYHNCQDQSNWQTRTGAWDNESEANCRQVTGSSSCFCYGPSLEQCYNSFSSKSGISCSRRLSGIDIIV